VKFYNATKNTIYLEDINKYIPFIEGLQEIDADSIKKSKAFQLLIKMGQIKIHEITNDRIERNMRRVSVENLPEQEIEIPVEENINMRVHIKGHFEDQGGYAKVNRNLAMGLKLAGVDVSIENVGPPQGLNEIEIKQLAMLKRKTRAKKCINIDSVVPSFSQVSTGNYNILYTTIESATVPDQFVEATKLYNEVWVVSDFCKEVLEKYDIGRSIFVLPDSLNTRLYTENGDELNFRPPLNNFVFVSVFNWSYRKGYDVLLKAYLKEFNGEEPVSLLIFSRFNNNRKQDKVIHEQVKNYVKEFGGDNPPHIAMSSQTLPEYMMPNLYRSCDVFVLLSRGEGYMLPAAESSLCGLPVISTNFGGHTMFLNKDNASLLDIDRMEKLQPGKMHISFWDNQEFPVLTSDKVITDAQVLMRNVYENPDRAKKKNKKLQQFLTENYSIGKIAVMAKQKLDLIWSKL
tara:strand:+ start:14 stop:1390 length:1377 start_codon:yes stop_codon:yes gene_type:complete